MKAIISVLILGCLLILTITLLKLNDVDYILQSLKNEFRQNYCQN